MSEQETVEVTLKFPKDLIDFLKAMSIDVEEYIVRMIVETVESELEADVFWNPKQVVAKYNLMAVFKKYGISLSSYLDPEEPY